jgi:hypothetical protein
MVCLSVYLSLSVSICLSSPQPIDDDGGGGEDDDGDDDDDKAGEKEREDRIEQSNHKRVEVFSPEAGGRRIYKKYAAGVFLLVASLEK